MKQYLIAMLIMASFSIIGCQSMGGLYADAMFVHKGKYEYMDTKNVSISERIKLYSNQLVDDNSQSYATIRSYPYTNYRDSFVQAYPFFVLKIDGKNIKNIPAKFGDSEKFNMIEMAHNPLKIPSGKHQLLFNTSTSEIAKYTQLPEFNFKPNTDYIVKPFFSSQEFKLNLYTYEYDKRFSVHDVDGIVLKDLVLSVSMNNATFDSNEGQ